MKFPMRLAVWVVSAAAVFTPQWLSAQDNQPFQIPDVRLGFMGTLKMGYWSPISIDVTCKNESLQGTMEVQVPDSDGLLTSSFREAFAAPGQLNRIQHHVKIGKFDSDVTIQLRDKNGSLVAERRVDVDADRSVRILNVDEQFVVYLGSPGGLFEATDDDTKINREKQTAIPMRILEDLPRQWFDYSGVDALVISTGDPTLFDKIDPAQQSAIRSWVRQGGHLVVSVARNQQIVAESFLSEMLPAKLKSVSRVRQPDTIESFAKSKDRLDVGAQGLEVVDFEDPKGQAVIRQGERPLALRGGYGLGTVTTIGFDVDEPPFTNWPGRIDFWIELFGFQRLTEAADEAQNLNRMSFSGTTDLATLLANHLEDFPEVTVVPFGWVALLIFGYILLIGPIDYLFLKKVVGRLELTWITFPTWVIVISVAAYYAAHWLKGDALRVNRVEIVDVDQSSDTLRGTGFLSIFSPRIDKYTVTYLPALAAEDDWEALGMGVEQAPRTCSWLGVPEEAFRGMMNQGSVGLFGRRGYTYAGQGVSAVADVPIQVWSVKSLTGQWLGKSKKVFDAKLTGRGLALSGSLKNLLDVPLHDVFIAYQDQVYQIPKIDPQGTVDLAAIRSRALTDFLGDRKLEQLDEWQLRQGRVLNAGDIDALVRSVLFTEKTPEAYRHYPSNYLRKLDLSDRLEIGKAIVVAKVEAPGGELWFNALPDGQQEKTQAPEIGGVVKTQTYLRVLLDPSKGNE